MSEAADQQTISNPPNRVEVNYEHSANFAAILEQLGISLLVSTYQAGKLIAVGTHAGQLVFAFYHFEQAMGVAANSNMIAVGSKRQIWFLKAAHDLAPRVEPNGRHDACYLTRGCHYTGTIHCHEMAWVADELWLVNTLFSCLCTLKEDFSFVPRWRPKFVTNLAGEDRCHLNGICIQNGQPRFVTAMAETDSPAGWRPDKATTGVIIDLSSGDIVTRGLSMPHSPRWHDSRLWVLDSGNGQLVCVDQNNGRCQSMIQLPGYTRGLAFNGPFAFVGLSLIRETAIFGGVPIAERRDRLQCGIAVIDLRTGQQLAGLVFHSGVQEIFDVQVLSGVRCPVLSGPLPDLDGQQTIWLAPPQRA
jgi:uncharacterized protein (TIGR03032 family)